MGPWLAKDLITAYLGATFSTAEEFRRRVAKLAVEIVRRGAARSGLTWHFNRPPVTGLEFEMDCRGVMYEQVVP